MEIGMYSFIHSFIHDFYLFLNEKVAATSLQLSFTLFLNNNNNNILAFISEICNHHQPTHKNQTIGFCR
jgi:hypothetical protein